MRKFIGDIGRGFYNLFIGTLIVALVAGGVAIANYAMTQGSGTNFGSIVVGGTVHYPQMLSCDPTTPAQCGAVDASGNQAVKDAAVLAAVQAPIPDCGATPCTNKVGSLAGQPDPCFATAKVNLPISLQTTSITQQIALSGSTKIYVCSLSLIASAATVFSVTGGTGTNCGTPAALIGTTSASHGLSLAANGGLTYGNGGSTVAVTGAGSELCLVQSGAGDLSGNLTYVQQ